LSNDKTGKPNKAGHIVYPVVPYFEYFVICHPEPACRQAGSG